MKLLYILVLHIFILLNSIKLFGMSEITISKVSDTQTLESIFGNSCPEELFESDLVEKCLAIWLCACTKPHYLPLSTQHNPTLYRCPIPSCCQTNCNRKNLELHVLAAHSTTRPYACLIPSCLSRFKNAKGLTEHLKKIHHVRTKTNQYKKRQIKYTKISYY